MGNKIIALFCCLILALSAFASDSIESARKAYDDGDYKKAVEIYNQIIKNEGSSAAIYYNLGNAALKNNDFATAVTAYKRASRLKPSDSEISGNLEYALSKVGDTNRMLLKGRQMSVTPDSPSFFSSLYLAFAAKVSSYLWAWLALFLFVVAVICMALYLFLTEVTIRKIGFFGAGISLLLSVVFVIFAFAAARYAGSEDECVAREYRFDLLSAPDSDSRKVASTLSAGTVFDIIERKKDADGNLWLKVRLNRDFIGWIPEKSVDII